MFYKKCLQDAEENFVFDVIVNDSGNEAAVTADEEVWIVTGNGKDFHPRHVPANSKDKYVELLPKGFFQNVNKTVHFLLCREDGSGTGVWKGSSYTVDNLGNDFKLLIEKEEGGDFKVLVEYEEHQEGKYKNLCKL